MPRAPLPIETWGKIWRTETKAGTPAAMAYYRDLDGARRRIIRTATSHAKAEAAAREALKVRLAPADGYLTGQTTLESLAETWLSDLEKSTLTPATIRRYRSIIAVKINRHVGAIRVSEATVPRLQRIIDDTDSTAQARMLGVVLTGMLDLAVRHGAIKDNPAKHLRLPQQTRHEVKAPTLDDLATLMNCLKTYDAVPPYRDTSLRDLSDIAAMMLATGARIGEVLALQWDDINIEAWTLTIQATIASVPGQGLIRQRPKTQSSVRTLALPEFIRPMLANRLQGALVKWIFTSASGGPRWPENIRNQWRDAVRGSAVEWIGPHDLRKAVATLLGTEGAKEQLGHAHIGVTDKHYIEKKTLRPDQTSVLDSFASIIAA